MIHTNNIRKTLSVVAAALMLLVVSTSCEHKDLYLRQQSIQQVQIHFDWANLLPDDEKPETMTLYFYDSEGNVYKYDVPTDNDDYVIEILSGPYTLVSYSTDDDYILGRNTDDVDNHDILAMELNKDVPAVYGYNDDVDIMYYDDEEGGYYDPQIITITPSQVYSNYNITVKSADLVEGAAVWSSSLSGLSNSVYASSHACSDNASESIIDIALTREDNTCTGTAKTFGQLKNKSNKASNKLLVTVLTESKTVVYYLFDVTDQILTAKDPRNVDIVVDLADAIPLQPGDPNYPGDDPKEEQGGLDAEVDEFGNNEDIDVNA